MFLLENSIGNYNHNTLANTYQHNNIVGTTNLGLVPERELLGNRRDYKGDTLHYCDTIIERDSGVIKYI